MARQKVVLGIEQKKIASYANATVVRVRDGTMDIELADGTRKNYVENSSGRTFKTGGAVSVIFFNREKTEAKIVGSGKKISRRHRIPEVLI